MSRTIKFRCFNKKKGEIQTVLELNENGVFAECDECQEGKDFYVFDEVELMQYTGLRDKSGKEIYEGDIIDDTHDRGVTRWNFKKAMFYIRWPDIDMGFPTGELAMSKYRIIGNIHENPELLK